MLWYSHVVATHRLTFWTCLGCTLDLFFVTCPPQMNLLFLPRTTTLRIPVMLSQHTSSVLGLRVVKQLYLDTSVAERPAYSQDPLSFLSLIPLSIVTSPACTFIYPFKTKVFYFWLCVSTLVFCTLSPAAPKVLINPKAGCKTIS